MGDSQGPGGQDTPQAYTLSPSWQQAQGLFLRGRACVLPTAVVDKALQSSRPEPAPGTLFFLSISHCCWPPLGVCWAPDWTITLQQQGPGLLDLVFPSGSRNPHGMGANKWPAARSPPHVALLFSMESPFPQLEAGCRGQGLPCPQALGSPFSILTNARVSEEAFLKAGRTSEGPHPASRPPQCARVMNTQTQCPRT